MKKVLSTAKYLKIKKIAIICKNYKKLKKEVYHILDTTNKTENKEKYLRSMNLFLYR